MNHIKELKESHRLVGQKGLRLKVKDFKYIKYCLSDFFHRYIYCFAYQIAYFYCRLVE